MISNDKFLKITQEFPFLLDLPKKLKYQIQSDLSPDRQIISVYNVTVRSTKGCLVVLENEVSVFYMTKFLFMKFPTIQNFNIAQINEAEKIGENGLYLHASADSSILNEHYEEEKFLFESSKQRDSLVQFLNDNCPRLINSKII